MNRRDPKAEPKEGHAGEEATNMKSKCKDKSVLQV